MSNQATARDNLRHNMQMRIRHNHRSVADMMWGTECTPHKLIAPPPKHVRGEFRAPEGEEGTDERA